MKTLLLLLCSCAALLAQTPRVVTLTWTDTANPTGTTYSVYRASGLCSGSPTFAKISSAITAKTYPDNSVTPGNYCYAVTATLNGMESAQSVSVGVAVTPHPPQNLQGQVQ